MDPTAENQETTNPPVKSKKSFVQGVKAYYISPDTRVGALLMTGVVVFMVGFGAYDLLGNAGPAVSVSNPGSANHVTNLPGGKKGGELYEKNLKRLNQQRAKEAEERGQSFIPTMTALHTVKPAPKEKPPAPQIAPAPAPAPQKPVVETSAQKGMAKDAQLELMRFINAPVPTPLTTSFRVAGKSSVAISHSAGNSGTAGELPKPVLARPGHISFGELLTAINSNEPGPVEAEIVSGRFRHARLLGQFRREHDRLVIQFDEMTWNHQSYRISAYAINAKTARTYVATSVNHHTLYRWGSLIAASFLGGVDNALDMANTNETLGNGYAVVTQQLTDGEIPLYAAGNVGNVLTLIMAKQFDTPPTVREAQGAPIGILFMKSVE